MTLKLIQEIDLPPEQLREIQRLRNLAFPDHQVERSYYKQLPHLRLLRYNNQKLIGHIGLDYRSIRADNSVFKILGVIDFCIHPQHQALGIGTQMLSYVEEYAQNKNVDFIVLLSDLDQYYQNRGFTRTSALSSWLRIDEHTNYGVAVEQLDDIYIKPLANKQWPQGHIDWLGYLF